MLQFVPAIPVRIARDRRSPLWVEAGLRLRLDLVNANQTRSVTNLALVAIVPDDFLSQYASTSQQRGMSPR